MRSAPDLVGHLPAVRQSVAGGLSTGVGARGRVGEGA